MEAKNKKINVVWCDDKIEDLVKTSIPETFEDHNCHIYQTAKTSEQLKSILATYENFIDAVIVDFNMGDTDEVPDRENASGFRWIHDNIHHYPSIPFYLGSGRDRTFIEGKYRAYDFPIDGDYFLSKNPFVSGERNRLFNIEISDEREAMLNMIEEEVEVRCSPAFRIRQEYAEAFDAIEKFGLNADVFINILLSDDNIDRYDIIRTANPLRMEIESLVSRLASAGVIPLKYVNRLNEIPEVLAGKDSRICSPEHRMPKSLREAFDFFLKYTQDGSHEKIYLSIDFKKYLESSRDVYIIKALAIIGLDIIKWASHFYDIYEPQHLCSFKPFSEKVSDIKTVGKDEGAIVYHDGDTFFVKQPQNEKYKYKEGTTVEIRIETIQPTKKNYGDYHCFGRNLDVEQ